MVTQAINEVVREKFMEDIECKTTGYTTNEEEGNHGSSRFCSHDASIL